jgi:hypothetical protein
MKPPAPHISRQQFLAQVAVATAALAFAQVAGTRVSGVAGAPRASVNTHWLRAAGADRQRWLTDCRGLVVREGSAVTTYSPPSSA